MTRWLNGIVLISVSAETPRKYTPRSKVINETTTQDLQEAREIIYTTHYTHQPEDT